MNEKMSKKFKEFRWRLKASGSIMHHDMHWKLVFINNDFEWKSWWEKYCDGMHFLVGSFNDDELLEKGLRDSASIFDKEVENELIKWLYSGNRKILEKFYNWFSDKMEEIREEEEKERNNILKREPLKKKKQEGYIYVIKSNKRYKIGRTLNLEQRIEKYITENPDKIEVILCEKVKDYVGVEKELHLIFEYKNHNREWFNLNNEDIKSIKNYLGGNKA